MIDTTNKRSQPILEIGVLIKIGTCFDFIFMGACLGRSRFSGDASVQSINCGIARCGTPHQDVADEQMPSAGMVGGPLLNRCYTLEGSPAVLFQHIVQSLTDRERFHFLCALRADDTV